MSFFDWDKGADIEGIYRYSLWRIWNNKKPLVLFIMLNPSTAGAETNDKTVRRCIRFAYDWHYGGFVIVNLFALRSRFPKELRTSERPVGPRNDEVIREQVERVVSGGGIILCAWGADGSLLERGSIVARRLYESGYKLYCLGLTEKAQHPRHPLYVKAEQRPKRFYPFGK